ncbi:hypothetical protein [uncultured Sneathiella sp.]|uniref:hypothetical protein n=1 Tax=uncultured Sneathiella sp. TaxID=879315 RepID=UPI0030DBFFA9
MALKEFKENMFDITGGEAGNARMLASIGDAHDGYLKSGFSLAQSFAQARDASKEKARKSTGDITFLTLLENQLAWLNDRIAEAEKSFEERYGEDWREQMAERILEPDEIPQRREGESMEDYRQRLEETLIEKMLDDTGEIKSEYLNDPELREWAQWAQRQYLVKQVEREEAYVNEPGISEEERNRRIAENEASRSFKEREEARIKDTDPDRKAEQAENYDQHRDQSMASDTTTADNQNSAFTLGQS